LPGTNTLAYYENRYITDVKKFYLIQTGPYGQCHKKRFLTTTLKFRENKLDRLSPSSRNFQPGLTYAGSIPEPTLRELHSTLLHYRMLDLAQNILRDERSSLFRRRVGHEWKIVYRHVGRNISFPEIYPPASEPLEFPAI
jgi:hypothetical protein